MRILWQPWNEYKLHDDSSALRASKVPFSVDKTGTSINIKFKMQPPDATTHQSSIVSLLPTTAKKVKQFSNVEIYQADMTHLKYADGRFDAVIAGNVIHLLDDPIAAVGELMRVCKPGGKVIIPTYTNIYNGKPSKLVKLFEKAGAHFKSQFDLYSYKAFFRNAGFENVDYHVVEGKMPCAVAVITKEHE